jgi:hypothetical protein
MKLKRLLLSIFLKFQFSFYLCSMPKKIKPTGRQKSIFYVHFLIYALASFFMLTTYDKGATTWVYPWPAWIVAAWGLSLIGHACSVFLSYQDKGHEEFIRQTQN